MTWPFPCFSLWHTLTFASALRLNAPYVIPKMTAAKMAIASVCLIHYPLLSGFLITEKVANGLSGICSLARLPLSPLLMHMSGQDVKPLIMNDIRWADGYVIIQLD